MATINPATVSDGETIDASDLNNPINTIADEINGNLDNDNIASGAAITPDKLAGGNSNMLGAWQTWTHNTSGPGSNYTVTARYNQVGKTVHLSYAILFTGTPSSMGNVSFDLPVTPDVDYASIEGVNLGLAHIRDAGSSTYYGATSITGSGQANIRPFAANTTYLSAANFTLSAPFTFTTDDTITTNFTYEAA